MRAKLRDYYIKSFIYTNNTEEFYSGGKNSLKMYERWKN